MTVTGRVDSVTSRAARHADVIATSTAVAVLALVNVTFHLLPGASVWLGLPAAAGGLLWARRRGLSWAELGLDRGRLGAGLRWGAAAAGVVVVIYLVGLLLPVTRPAFRDTRYHVGVLRALYVALVQVPLGTVLFEEIAFRGVLWGFLSRWMQAPGVLAGTSALFGLWHVIGALHLSSSNAGVHDVVGGAGATTTIVSVLGTVALTGLGGLVFGELRRRSGSVLACMLAHWATNGAGVLFGLAAWALA